MDETKGYDMIGCLEGFPCIQSSLPLDALQWGWKTTSTRKLGASTSVEALSEYLSFWSEPRQLQQPRLKMTYYWRKNSQYGVIVDMTFPFRASISKFQACADWASKLVCEANTSFNEADTCMKRRVWPEGKIKARWAQSKECCDCINWAVVDGNMQSVSRQE